MRFVDTGRLMERVLCEDTIEIWMRGISVASSQNASEKRLLTSIPLNHMSFRGKFRVWGHVDVRLERNPLVSYVHPTRFRCIYP